MSRSGHHYMEWSNPNTERQKSHFFLRYRSERIMYTSLYKNGLKKLERRAREGKRGVKEGEG